VSSKSSPVKDECLSGDSPLKTIAGSPYLVRAPSPKILFYHDFAIFCWGQSLSAISSGKLIAVKTRCNIKLNYLLLQTITDIQKKEGSFLFRKDHQWFYCLTSSYVFSQQQRHRARYLPLPPTLMTWSVKGAGFPSTKR